MVIQIIINIAEIILPFILPILYFFFSTFIIGKYFSDKNKLTKIIFIICIYILLFIFISYFKYIINIKVEEIMHSIASFISLLYAISKVSKSKK